MSEHTPGPWEASEGVPSDIWHVDMPDRQFSITVSRGGDDWDMTVEEVQANARLIAAAPDMLAALEALVKWGERPVSNHPAAKHYCDSGVWNAAIDAIEKAKAGGAK